MLVLVSAYVVVEVRLLILKFLQLTKVRCFSYISCLCQSFDISYLLLLCLV